MNYTLIRRHVSGPVGAIVHLGAGLCSELATYAEMAAERIVLVEAIPEQVVALERRASSFRGTEVVHATLSGCGGFLSFNVLNLIDASSLHKPTGLVELFPGIAVTREVKVETQRPQEILKTSWFDSTGKHWLIIDVPGEELAVLRTMKEDGSLESFDRLILNCGRRSLYERGEPAERCLEFLSESEYDILEMNTDRDPDRPEWILGRNPIKRENTRIDGRIGVISERTTALEREAEERTIQIEKLSEALGNREREIRQLSEEIKKSSEQHGEQAQTPEQGQTNTGFAGGGGAFDKVLAMLQDLRAEVAHLKEDTEARVFEAVKASSRQIKSYIALESYLRDCVWIPNLDGWTISPDLAICLVRLILDRRYDVVIEFGSGASTIIMAAAMLKQSGARSAHRGEVPVSWDEAVAGSAESKVEKSAARMMEERRAHSEQAVVVAFEHNQKYFRETSKHLRQAGIADWVSLNYAPLEDYISPLRDRFLYYRCEREISELSERLGDGAKILILVDGPPATVGPHARYPALPILLQHLASHQLDIVLDDYSRADERKIVGDWMKMLDERQIAYERLEFEFEKGACLMRLC